MIFKYTLRLIKSTLNRFIAILAIVFIGVSFMMGLRSNYDIMKESVENYYDDCNLYDAQIYSNYGFRSDDINAIKKLDYIEDVYASKSRDVYGTDKNGNVGVTRAIELESNLNQIELIEGRYPENNNECLIIYGYTDGSFEIGDTLTISLPEENILETFSNDKFTIVGKARSCEHLSHTYSTSLLNNQTLSDIIYIRNSAFISDYYTIAYLNFVGSKDLNSFNNEYEDYIDEKTLLLEDFSKIQSQDFRDQIIKEAEEKLEEGRKELEENREKYQKELDDAKKKLNDAKVQLDDAKKQIEDGENELPEAKKKLEDSQAQVNSGYKEIENSQVRIDAAINEIESYGMSMNELEDTINNVYSSYTQTLNKKSSYENQKDELDGEYEDAKEITNVSSYSNSNQVRWAMYYADRDSEEYANLKNEYNAFVVVESYNARNAIITAAINLCDYTLNQYNSQIQEKVGMDVETAYDTVTSAIEKIRDGQRQIRDGKNQLESAQRQIDQGWIDYEEGKKELEQGKIDYQKGLEEYEKGQKEYNDGLAKFEKEMQDAEDKIEDGENEIKDLKKAEWTILKRYNTNYSFYMYKNTCEQMKSIGTITPILFFIVAALVCATTMTRLIDEQRSQIGIYRALGFRNNEIISIYLLYVLIASLVASVIAIFVGVAVFPTIIYTTWRLMYDLPSIVLSMPFDNVIICVSSFSLLISIVSYIVIKTSLKECAAQLLRPKAPKNTKKILLEKFTWLWNKLSFTGKVTARNLFRYKARFIMTVIGIAGCTSLLLMGWGIKDSIGSVVSLQYKDIYKYNYLVDLKNDRHIDQIKESIRIDNTNTVYVPFMSYQTVLNENNNDSNISIIVIDSEKEQDIYNMRDINTNNVIDLDNEGVVLTEKFAKKNNYAIGDEIDIKSKEGILKTFIVKGISINYIQNYIYMSEKLYSSAFNEEIEYNLIAVNNTGDASKLVKLSDEYRDVNSVNDFTESVKTFEDMINALDLIIIIIILVAGALAFVVLINLTNVNISERIREIATLKVLGFRENEVNSYIFKEVLLMSLIGAIIGLPLGKIESRYILTVIDMDMCMFPHIVESISYLYAFAITMIFTVIVLLLTRKTLRKVEMIESLKSVE